MLRDVLGVSQDANHFEDAPCTDLSLLLWDPQHEGESQADRLERHRLAVEICRAECRAIGACAARRDRLHAAGRRTAGVWAGEMTRGGGRPRLYGCGSQAGYQAHRKAGEAVCDACARAHREYMRNYRKVRRSV